MTAPSLAGTQARPCAAEAADPYPRAVPDEEPTASATLMNASTRQEVG